MEPRENQDVNRWWMCDAGRLDYKFVNEPTRLKAPRLRDGDTWREAGWEEAIAAAGRLLKGQKGDVLLDGNLTLEEMRLSSHLAHALGGKARYAARTGQDGDDFLIVNEKGANAKGAEALGLARQSGPGEALVLLVEREGNVPAELRDGSGAKVVFALDERQVPPSAEVVFPLGSWAERDGLLVNVDGHVQEIRRVRAVGPKGLLPLLEVMEEVLLEVDETHDALGREGLLAEIRALPALKGRAFPEVAATDVAVGGAS